MSFFLPPSGLVASSRTARYVDVHENGEWESGSIITCPPPEEFLEEYLIFIPEDDSVDFTADPGDMEFLNPPVGFQFTDLDQFPYYAIRVKFNGPNGLGFWHDPPGCFGVIDYGLDGPYATLELNGDFIARDGGTAETSLEGGPPTTSPLANSLSTEWVYLVNPDPPWPSPDFEGNTFGSVLWLAEDIPTITGTIATTRGPGTGGSTGVLQAYLNPYFEGEPEEMIYSSIIGNS